MKHQQLWKNLEVQCMNKKIVIIGASGHGKVVANIAKLNGYKEIIFLDDDKNKKECGQYKIIGTSNQVDSLIKKEYEFAVAIGDNQTRERIFKELVNKEAGVPVLIHPSAVIDETVTIGNGTVVMANAVINSSSIIGEACIINTASSIDHDCVIGNYVHVSPGVNIAGTVTVGFKTWIGVGSTVINNLNIGKECTIGAGCVVIKDLLESGTYVGIPIRRIKIEDNI